MNSTKINQCLSSLNVVNIIIGYTFFVSILIPFTSNQIGASQIVTIPYRGFSLLLSLIVLLLNIRANTKITFPILLYFCFWIWVIFRIFYDLEIRTDYFVKGNDKLKIWLISVAGCFIPMFSIYKSQKKIDFNFSFKILYIACIVILIPSFLFSLKELDQGQRETGNIALDPISFAMAGITLTILSWHQLVENKISSLSKIVMNLIFGFLGIFLALKTGSRGPILGLFLISIIWYSIKTNRGFKFYAFSGIVFFLLMNQIIQLITIAAPLLGNRITEGISGEDMSLLARQETYFWFIEKIRESPIIGSQFAKLGNGTFPGYAHSIILDLLLGFGIVGLCIFFYCTFKAFKRLQYNILIGNIYWPGLVMLQYFFLAQTSGAFYSDPQLCNLILLSLILPKTQIYSSR